MITIISDSGDVKFLNENEFIRIDFNKSDRKVVAHPIQRNAHIGMPYPIIEVSDVQSIAYTNEAQPTSLIFETKDLKLSKIDNDSDLYGVHLLPTVAINILNKFGIKTIGQIMQLRKSTLLNIYGIGKMSLSMIDDYLEEHDANWGQNYLIAFYKKVGSRYDFSHFELTEEHDKQSFSIPSFFLEREKDYFVDEKGCKIIEQENS
jgi:hypothetical protein